MTKKDFVDLVKGNMILHTQILETYTVAQPPQISPGGTPYVETDEGKTCVWVEGTWKRCGHKCVRSEDMVAA